MNPSDIKTEEAADRVASEIVEQVSRDHQREAKAKFGEWVSVEERLPDEGAWVLCWIGSRAAMSGQRRDGQFWLFEHIDQMIPKWEETYVTHWMPLPPGPEK